MNAKTKGYILGAVAAATYGMNPLFALPLYENGMDTDSVLLFRYLFALPLLGVMLKARGRDFRLQRREILPLIVLGLLVAVSSLTLFQSYHYMDAGIASTLLFVYPILVALIMAVAFKEKVTLQTALCILLALCGIGLLYRNGDGSTLNLTGTIMVFASALSYALYIVGINRTVLKNVATLKVTFYILLSGLTLFFVRLDFGEHITVPGPMVLVGKSAGFWRFSRRPSRSYVRPAPFNTSDRPRQPFSALEPVTAVFFGVAASANRDAENRLRHSDDHSGLSPSSSPAAT